MCTGEGEDGVFGVRCSVKPLPSSCFPVTVAGEGWVQDCAVTPMKWIQAVEDQSFTASLREKRYLLNFASDGDFRWRDME
ncbi:hypothetical protein ROHU_005435 [Labeo rohita]|uniref:Uncharacterized protein n=1 Tax=Labeo rohita TaxID=84645 RepID=A0A498N895_LABRO|nr:hypothetical protein ROHU_005435 [Labeo rohita]